MKPTPVRTGLLAVVVALACAIPAAAQRPSLVTVQVDKPGAAISPTLFGLFFEDINFGADGGLYPERVKNRSFEFPIPMTGWKQVARGESKGALYVYEHGAGTDGARSHYLRIKAEPGGAGFGVTNEGFRGMGVRENVEYTLSVRARRIGDGPGSVRVELEDENGRTVGAAKVDGLTADWKKLAVAVKPSATVEKARLAVLVDGGTVDLDVVSLFPKETWKNRENGLRADLVKLLAEMKPGFLRFPGGCIVEGSELEKRYQWKTTVGDVDARRLLINRWNYEFKHRPAPDYFQSFGLGFYEYFLLSEDIGAEPLPILNCGMACQFNTGELVPLDELDPYVRDALDLIEFANGPVTSTWGRLRAEMGHPAPFNLKMLGVGNEQWGLQYVERFQAFSKVLKAKHPEIKLVGSVGPFPDGEQFDLLWPKMRELNADLVDEHYYRPPAWFPVNVNRYDNYPRTGPKVFAGEYAAQSVAIASPDNRNNWECALSEAAFMTGLERNADVVLMSSYAPLFGHVEGWQWTPNLIWFDNLRSFGTPNYYVQKLFSVNRGTSVLPVLLDGASKNGQGTLFASASRDDRAGEVVLKLVNLSPSPREVRIKLAGAKQLARTGKAFVLAGADLKAENSLDEPTRVAPVEQELTVRGDSADDFAYTLAPNSLVVLRVGTK